MDFFAKKQSSKPTRRVVPWAEKYRPRTLGEVTAQDQVVATLQKTLGAANLPHMLFYGPPGTGKTSTILALARDLFGPELSKTRVLELNASDERGIAVVRNKIKTFAQGVVSAPSGEDLRYPCPNFKIIVLDEADSMTQDAQAALRRIMETNSKYTRFCLVCNYVTRIIDPVASRCTKFRFGALNGGDGLARLREICAAEGLAAPDASLEHLLAASQGDLRRAITLLQSARGLVTSAVPLSSAMVDEISGTVPAAVVDGLVAALLDASRPLPSLAPLVKDILYDGWSVGQLLGQAHDLLLAAALEERKKARIAVELSRVDRSLVDGCDEHLVLLDMAYKVGGIVRA